MILQCVVRWIVTMSCFTPSACFTASLLKHGREASIFHSHLLSRILLCTIFLIVNLRSYDAEVRPTCPSWRVTEFACAIFKDVPSHLGDTGTCLGSCAGLERRSLVKSSQSGQSHQSQSRELAWWNIQPVTVRQTLRRRRAILFLFSWSVINPLSQEAPHSLGAVLQQSPVSDSLFTVQLHRSSCSTKDAVIKFSLSEL